MVGGFGKIGDQSFYLLVSKRDSTQKHASIETLDGQSGRLSQSPSPYEIC